MDTESRVMEHLRVLSERIGPRPTGSRANQETAAYIHRVFESCGLAVQRQEFPFPSWEHRSTCLQIGDEPLEATANLFSPSCDLTGTVVPLSTVRELEEADLINRIGLLYGDLTREQLAAKGAIYVPERDKRIITLLESKSPAALITVSTGLDQVRSVIQDWDLPVPSATVPAHVGMALVRRAGEQIRFRIDTRTMPGYSSNIVATQPGTREERIVLCAHYDTYPRTPGAWDNGSGIAVILTLAEILGKQDLSVGLEWVAFNGEELGGVGDLEYLHRRRNELNRIVAGINTDGVGQELGVTSIATFAASSAFQEHVSALVEEQHPEVVEVAPWPASDHYTFYSNGVPSIALTSSGYGQVLHRPEDTLEWISPARLSGVISLVADLVQSLQDKPAAWGRTNG